MDNPKLSILLVEDDDDNASKIRRTIKAWCANNPNDAKFSIEFLGLQDSPFDETNSEKEVFDAAIEAISEGRINGVIIDFRMNKKTQTHFNGADLFREIANAIPRFPQIILTNRPEDCEKAGIVDYDKIYSKLVFFRADEEKSNNLVKKYLFNIVKFLSDKDKLERLLTDALDGERSLNNERYLAIEKEYGLYVPYFQARLIMSELGDDFLDKLSNHLDDAMKILSDLTGVGGQ